MNKMPIAAILAMCVLSSPVWSENLSVGVEASDYMPIYKGDGAGYKGYARELLDSFASKNGYSFTYVVYPVARLHTEFAVKKSLDFKYPDNAYWAREVKKDAKITYSKGTITVTEGLMVLPGRKGKGNITSIATLRGFTPYPYLDQIKKNAIAVTEANSPESVISMGEAGRVDAVYLGVISANYLMAEVMRKPGILVFDDALPSTRSDFSLSSIEHPEVIRKFDEYLVNEKETIAKLKAKYKIVE